MASVYDLKPKFQNLLRPLCAGLVRSGVTANHVTVAAMVLSIVWGLAIYLTVGAAWTLLLLPVVLFIRMALNAIDGMLAREFNQKSRLGAVLNELGDVISDTALYLPLAMMPGYAGMLVVLIVIVGVITEMTGIVAIQIGATRRYDGPFGKSDRAAAFGLLAFILGLGVTPGPWTVIVMSFALAAGLWTIINRAQAALRDGKA